MKRSSFAANALKYGAANVLRNIASVLLLPVYTHALSPSSYGVLEIIGAINALMAGLFGLQIGESLFRRLPFESEPSARHELIVSAVALATIANVAAILIIATLSIPLAVFFLHDKALWLYIVISSFVLFFDGFSSILLTLMRENDDSTYFFKVSIMRLIAQILFSLLALFWFKAGLVGIVIANVLVSAISAASTVPYWPRSKSGGISWPVVRSYVQFGLPLSMAGIPGGLVASADRFFLSRLGSLSDLGIYSLANRISQTIVTLVYSPFSQAWDGKKYHAWSDSQGTLVPTAFILMNFMLVFFWLVISLFSKEVIEVFSANRFASAADVVPIITLFLIVSANSEFVRVSILAAGRTRTTFVIALSVLCFVVPLFALMIPFFGVRGAAMAMLLGAVFRLAVEQHISGRLNAIKLPWRRAISMTALGATVWVCAKYSHLFSGGFFVTILIKSCLVMVFLTVIRWLNLVNHSESRALYGGVASFLKKS